MIEQELGVAPLEISEDYRVPRAIKCAQYETDNPASEAPHRLTRNSITAPSPALSFNGPHGLMLRATSARRVGDMGKCEVTFDVHIGAGKPLPMTVTTSESSKRDASRELCRWIMYAGDREKIKECELVQVRQFVAATLSNAGELVEHLAHIRRLDERNRPRGRTMQEIIIDRAPKIAGLAFKETDGRIWSETEGRPIDFREFQFVVAPELAKACEAAIDYPQNCIGRSAPVGKLRQYLSMAWAHSLNHLPSEIKANTGPDSKAALRFSDSIVHLFTIRERWQKIFNRDGSERGFDSATLAQMAREKIECTSPQHVTSASGWQRIHNGSIDAWYAIIPRLRADGTRTGEPPDAWLAFRFDIVHQLPKSSRPELPNTRGMIDLGILARRYGLVAPEPPCAKVKERGREFRLIVLSRNLCDKILWRSEGMNDIQSNTLSPVLGTASLADKVR